MKKRKRSGRTAAGIIAGAVALSSGLLFGCEKNVPTSVYGPPPDNPNDLDPSQNIQEDVYGPVLITQACH